MRERWRKCVRRKGKDSGGRVGGREEEGREGKEREAVREGGRERRKERKWSKWGEVFACVFL